MTHKEKEELAARANEAIKTVKGVDCGISSYFDITTITIGPERVEMKPHAEIIAGKEPERRAFKTIEEYKAARVEWRNRAMPLCEAAFKEACKLLRKSKIRYRTGRYYGWPFARLA